MASVRTMRLGHEMFQTAPKSVGDSQSSLTTPLSSESHSQTLVPIDRGGPRCHGRSLAGTLRASVPTLRLPSGGLAVFFPPIICKGSDLIDDAD